MDEEKKVSDETEEEVEVKPEAEAKVEEAKEVPPKKEDFVEEEFVPKNKYNQALRKLREMELEKIDLARKVAPAEQPPVAKKAPAPVIQPTPKKKSYWEEQEEEEQVEVKAPAQTIDEEAIARVVEERIKPIYDAQKESFEKQKKNDRAVFFEKNPKYLSDSVSWQELIEEMNRSINPNSGDSYFEQLEKARILLESSTAINQNVEDFKKNVAVEAANVTPQGASRRANADDKITPEDRKIMKEYNISEEGMVSYKKKVKDGDMLILGMK